MYTRASRQALCYRAVTMRVVPLSLSLSSENREEKMATWNLGGEAVFSLAVFFRVRHDGLSERETTRSLYNPVMSYYIKLKRSVFA